MKLADGLGATSRRLITQVWSNDFARLATLDDGHQFEAYSCAAPMQNPPLEQREVVAFHELEASRKVRFNPTINVLQTFREAAARLLDTLKDGEHVVAVESFDHHEEHFRSPARWAKDIIRQKTK